MPRSLKLYFAGTLAMLAAGWIASATPATCQDESEPGIPLNDLPDRDQRYYRVVSDSDEVYQLTVEGLIQRSIVYGRIYKTPLPLVELLAEPTISRELEIVESQCKELEAQVNKLQEACKKADAVYAERPSADQLKTETLKILEPAIEEAIQTIRETLLAIQADPSAAGNPSPWIALVYRVQIR